MTAIVVPASQLPVSLPDSLTANQIAIQPSVFQGAAHSLTRGHSGFLCYNVPLPSLLRHSAQNAEIYRAFCWCQPTTHPYLVADSLIDD